MRGLRLVMRKLTQRASGIFVAFTIVGIVILGIYNAAVNDHFWEISFSSCTSIAIAVTVSYLLVQRQTDKRKQKDILLDLMTAIQGIVEDRGAYLIDESVSQQSLTMRMRALNNRVNILKSYAKDFGIKDDVDFISAKCEEYSIFVGENIMNIPYLQQSETALRRPLELISNRLFEAMLSLYK